MLFSPGGGFDRDGNRTANGDYRWHSYYEDELAGTNVSAEAAWAGQAEAVGDKVKLKAVNALMSTGLSLEDLARAVAELHGQTPPRKADKRVATRPGERRLRITSE